MRLDPLVAYDDDPLLDTVHHPYSAASQGYDAAGAGHPESACPYPEPAPPAHPFARPDLRRTFWLDGWREWHEQEAAYRHLSEPTPPQRRT